MVLISGGPLKPGEESDPGAGEQGDPLRLAVHVSLALYLMPVVLVVCMIGGASILAGEAAKLVKRTVLGASRRKGRGRPCGARQGGHEVKPPLAIDRGRPEAVHRGLR